MRVEIRVGRRGFRRWHQALAERLVEHRVADVRIGLVGDDTPLEGAAEALLALERLVLRRSRPSLSDRLGEVVPAMRASSDFVPDIVVDCSGRDLGPPPASVLLLRPLYDGFGSDHVLVAAILSGAMPRIEIEDVGATVIVASGSPSGESTEGLTGGIEAVVSRVIVLLESVIRRPRSEARHDARPRHPATLSRVVKFALRNLAQDCARAIYHLCLYSPHWRIGWRLHDGPGVIERGDLGGPRWTILSDPGRRFFADPFPVTWGGRTFVFFEDLDHAVGKGVISAIEFGPDGPVGEARPVLEEPWHMSYPFIMEDAGALYMVPESSASRTIPIYRCIDFPDRWERIGTLLDGVEAGDATLFRHDGLFWMTAAVREGVGGYSDMLAIHYATHLLGEWSEHAARPVLIDVAAARPAGAVVTRNGRLWRPIQDCTLGYGRELALAEIDRLDREHFSQTIRTRIAPGPLWPGKRLHTLNRTGRLECIDGTTYNPRLAAARGLARRMVPQAAPDASLGEGFTRP